MTPNDGSIDTPGMDNENDRPIPLLRDQELETSPEFMARVRGKIHRRTATAQVATFSWQFPKIVLVEMIGLISHLFRSFGTTKDSQR